MFHNYGYGILRKQFNDKYPDIPDEKIGFLDLEEYLGYFYIVPEYGIRGGEGKPMLCMNGSGVPDMNSTYASSQEMPCLCSKYVCASGDHGYTTADTCLQTHLKHIYIRDLYYGVDEDAFKESLKGVLVAYLKE